MMPQHDPVTTARLEAELRTLTEEKILVTLRLRGPRAFRQLRRDLPNLTHGELDNALKRLAKADCVRTTERGPKSWHLTPTGLARVPVLSSAADIAAARDGRLPSAHPHPNHAA
jgi:DNA-binding HxlR family transcriptional regulator